MTQERASKKQQETVKRRAATESTQDHAVDPTPSAASDINMMTHHDILTLQRQVGNHAVMRMLKQRSPAKPAKNLPDQLEGALGKAFGTDLSGVQIHTDANANQVARSANADATTMGQDIYFSEGAYNPGTASGNALIAREVAHIEQARSSGDLNDHMSSEASASERRDADNVSGIVHEMGANPALTLQPIQKRQASPIQRRVIQRAGGANGEGSYSHTRSLGIASSKIVQGVFTTILGPLSLVWRWPLIQKNIGEALGDDFGTWKGKPDDKLRYGGGDLGEALRFMALVSEILKEMLIWAGFATLITAVVAGVTHGALAPVFLGIAVATAMIGGVLFALKSIMTGFNIYRLYKLKEDDPNLTKKRQHIKNQIANDGMDAFSALLATIFAALGAGGVTATVGGAVAKDLGYTEGAAKGVGSGLNMATQGLTTNVVNNTAKESLKEAAKPGKEHGVFGRGGEDTKDGKVQAGGFGKDALVIKDAYKPTWVGKKIEGAYNFVTGKGKDSPDPTPQVAATGSDDAQLVTGQLATVVTATKARQGDQAKDVKDMNKALRILDDNSGPALKTAADVGKMSDSFTDSEQKAKAADSKFDDLVTVKDESEAEAQESKINAQLASVGEPKIEGIKKPGILSQIGSWFASKLGGIKRGARRLWNWIMRGIIRFAARLSSKDANPSSVAAAVSEGKTFGSEVKTSEASNTVIFDDIVGKAVQAQEGAKDLALQEQKQESD